MVSFTAFIVLAVCLIFHVGASSHCRRLNVGDAVSQPRSISSLKGILALNMTYYHDVDALGLDRFCYTTADGAQNPTLRLFPNDVLRLTLYNGWDMPDGLSTAAYQQVTCGSMTMSPNSTNLHFHGIHTSPQCPHDEVVHTFISSGQYFVYEITIPRSQPPGLYWYHPHVHTMSEGALLGGASGAIIIEGVESAVPSVAGLPEQLLIFRADVLPSSFAADTNPLKPNYDVSLNLIPIKYPSYSAALLNMQPSQKQLWRILNAASAQYLDLEILFDDVPQVLSIVSVDGVPIPQALAQTHVLIPAAGRVEIVFTGPASSVGNAVVNTRAFTGAFETYPAHVLLKILSTIDAPDLPFSIPFNATPTVAINFTMQSPARTRHLYFDEAPAIASQPNGNYNFFLTEEGHNDTVFNASAPPTIRVNTGTVEDWIIQNRATETHTFHMHQVHFKLLATNGLVLPVQQQLVMDTVGLDTYSGSGPFPNVTIRLDFTETSPGIGLYHCHQLYHEDNGMMQTIEFVASSAARPKFIGLILIALLVLVAYLH